MIDYLVVDLSAGSDASGWPMSELNDVPSGGWSDEYKTFKLVMRRIPTGTCSGITISNPFYIGAFEVTEKQATLIIGENAVVGLRYVADDAPYIGAAYVFVRGNNQWPNSTVVGDSSCMGRLQRKTGLSFDLPMESQWEYACRAGTTTSFNNGKNLTASPTAPDSAMNEVGRYCDNVMDGKGKWTPGMASVGAYKPNQWGIYDMHGNAWEWCLDWVTGYTGDYRALRGGSYSHYASQCTSSSRGKLKADGTNVNGGTCLHFSGFRLCCPAGL